MSKLDPKASTIANTTAITSGPRSTPDHMLQPAVPSIRDTWGAWASVGRAAGVTSASPPRDTLLATGPGAAPERRAPGECMPSRTYDLQESSMRFARNRGSSTDYALIGAAYEGVSAL